MSKKKVRVGNVYIGGSNPITVQSMLNVPSGDVNGNVQQALRLQKAGCEIIRVAVPNKGAIKLIYELKQSLSIPVVADIHFDYRLAIESIEAGADKIRINPGNIGNSDRVKAVVNACKVKNIPIRIGVNSGSLEKEILQKYGSPTAQALCESALQHVSLLERFDFDDIVISVKSSDVITMINAYKLIAQRCEYPLHIGVTESGTERIGIIKSSCGIGALISQGIGDTIRVSLTADPEREVHVGFDILRSLNCRKIGVQIISCPTCGRTQIDLIDLVNRAESALSGISKSIKVAIMGCVVNGPGEASEADIGIAGGDGVGLIFKKGEIVAKVREDDLLDELVKQIKTL